MNNKKKYFYKNSVGAQALCLSVLNKKEFKRLNVANNLAQIHLKTRITQDQHLLKQSLNTYTSECTFMSSECTVFLFHVT